MANLFFPFLCIRVFPSSRLSLQPSIFLFLRTPITVFWAAPIPSSKESDNYFASNSSSPEDEEFISFSSPALEQAAVYFSGSVNGVVCFAQPSWGGEPAWGGQQPPPPPQKLPPFPFKNAPRDAARLPRGF